MGENKVASFDRQVAGEAGFEICFVVRFAAFELSEPPSARRGVSFRVLDHKLNIRGISGHERLGSAKDLVVFLRRDVTQASRAMIVPSGNGNFPSR